MLAVGGGTNDKYPRLGCSFFGSAEEVIFRIGVQIY